MRSIARKFFTDLSDFDPKQITLNNYRRINEAEKLYSMFGQSLFTYAPLFSDIESSFDKESIRSLLPHQYSMTEIDTVHSLSACWYAFTNDSFTEGFAFPGSNDQIRQTLSDIPGMIFLSTNGLNLLQNLKNCSRIKICYCRTIDEVLQNLQNEPVSLSTDLYEIC